MRRTLIVLVIVALGIVLVATPGLVAAKGGHGGGGQGGTFFNAYGTIDAYDCDAGYIAMTVSSPSSLAGELTVRITDGTRFKECDDEITDRITCGELVAGWHARISGDVEGQTYFANRVIQYVP